MPDTQTPTPPKPGRGAQTARDMVLSLAALLLILLAVLGFSNACQFSPGGPTINTSAVPSVDVHSALSGVASGLDLPVREPKLPAGWRANSTDTISIGAGDQARPVVRVGWLAPAGGFLRLSQTQGGARELIASETDDPKSEPAATGTIDVAGVNWTIYPARRDETSWLAEVGGVRLLISGNGKDADFRTLAQAAQTATPLPKKS
ncbi:DUF4245 domain-containing protein [Kutzneria sp. CA-103260]|uniref:DUF4245 domain-containing protein n=1 Tax=Kutzneria sp. CA-103260 TaxID=2802641 RepID=UPI001BAD6393|nr:DUF4245 domain-containing protein [Kutzneria sp. CA-103260]QUQ69140.1 hypothetical protein JJ691_68940 [Kutzneria sp. CA-103260]